MSVRRKDRQQCDCGENRDSDDGDGNAALTQGSRRQFKRHDGQMSLLLFTFKFYN